MAIIRDQAIYESFGISYFDVIGRMLRSHEYLENILETKSQENTSPMP